VYRVLKILQSVLWKAELRGLGSGVWGRRLWKAKVAKPRSDRATEAERIWEEKEERWFRNTLGAEQCVMRAYSNLRACCHPLAHCLRLCEGFIFIYRREHCDTTGLR